MPFHIPIAWRKLRKNPGQTAILLLSLILGLSFSFLISLWIGDELSYDTGFPQPEDLCRVETTLTMKDGTVFSLPAVGWPVGRALRAEYPEIAALTYMRSWSPVINFKGTKFYESAFFADEHFFDVLGYRLEEGNAAVALKQPRSIVISGNLKRKYFGNESRVLGRTLTMGDTTLYTITGVLAEQRAPSHLQFDLIGSFSSLLAANPELNDEFTSGWFDVNVFNYVRLKKPATAASLKAKAGDLILRDGKAAVASTGMKSVLAFRPVKDIYLRSGMSTGATPVGDIRKVRLFTLIDIIILIIACMNFINLTTARSVERAKEVGIRKVLGSRRAGLIGQFLVESSWLCVLAAIISMFIVWAMLPAFNDLAGKTFTLRQMLTPGNGILLVSVLALVIPLAGFYPAWVLSGFKPLKVLKGHFIHSGSGNLLRRALVVAQFVISIGFILSALLVWKQMRFMQGQSLGFDKDKVLLINTAKVPGRLVYDTKRTYKTTLLGLPGIGKVSACQAVPGRAGWDGQFAYPEGRTKEQGTVVEYIPVDPDYLATLGLQLVAGRDFIPTSQDDLEKNLIINEAAVSNFGWRDAAHALGKKLSTSGKEGVVIGVLRNYHQHSLREQMKPVVLGIGEQVNLFAVRYSGTDPGSIVRETGKTWSRFFKGYAFDYRFLDEDFQRQYKQEAGFERLFGVAAALSVAIACLGLLGLSMYNARTRVKEIGIRKILGASPLAIVRQMSRESLLLIGLALALAFPLSALAMSAWLRDFAYHTSFSWWLFPLAGGTAIAIAGLTIATTTLKAALGNPVKSLREE